MMAFRTHISNVVPPICILNFGVEHLVFIGSEDYPYKGILDNIANRCFAQGTNAWTDVDHTWYVLCPLISISFTLEVAGIEGFMRILPIYLDVLLLLGVHD